MGLLEDSKLVADVSTIQETNEFTYPTKWRVRNIIDEPKVPAFKGDTVIIMLVCGRVKIWNPIETTLLIHGYFRLLVCVPRILGRR